jgi:hypothetical protein
MALDNFYFKVNKLDVLPDEYAAANFQKYGTNTKIIYGIYATAHAEKNGVNFEQAVSSPVLFNEGSDFVNWENLTEETIVSWLEAFVNTDEIKQKMENNIDNMTSVNTQINLPWSS